MQSTPSLLGRQKHRPVKSHPQLVSAIGNAAILGVDDVTGSIQEGKFADVAVWTGHPLRQCAAHVTLCATAGEIWRAD